MPIIGELNNAVDAIMLPEVLGDGLVPSSQTVNILKSRANIVQGPAGNDIEYTWQTEVADGRFYRGSPQAQQVADRGEPISSRVQWSNFSADIVLNGWEMEAIGLTIEDLLTREVADISDPQSQYSRVYNICDEKVMASNSRLKTGAVAACWGKVTQETENPNYAPEGLDAVFQENGTLHGLTAAALGNFGDAEGPGPWADGTPPNAQSWNHNDLTDTQKMYRHQPQVFGATSPRTISFDVLHQANVAMDVAIPGTWLCPLHHTLWTALTKRNDGPRDLTPLVIGYGQWRQTINVLYYDNVFYYRENFAPENEAWHIHIGEMGMDGAMSAGFRMNIWENPRIREVMLAMEPENPFAETPESWGYQVGFPSWLTAFRVADDREDTIYARQRSKFCFGSKYRWKMYKVTNLTA